MTTIVTRRIALLVTAVLGLAGCRASAPEPPAAPVVAQSVVLITIDTLRADHVGAYGAADARTPALDQLARDGARADRAWAVAPITLTSHASLMTGQYPPHHGARHNGIALAASVPTLAGRLREAGFRTGAFVSAFPLEKRFGLAAGFDVYDDTLPRGADGRPRDERPGDDTVTRALAWWQAAPPGARRFLWVHLFEPHSPYGAPGDTRPMRDRYRDDIASADRAVSRLLGALGPDAASTLVIAAADHGEAFGEHGEIGHSVFVYDTTLRVPLLLRGPGVPAGAVLPGDVSLVDVAPTVAVLTGTAPLTGDGVSLVPLMTGGALAPRALYAESFAPYFDFGWAGLRAVREGGAKYIAAPRPELFDLAADAGETHNRVAEAPRDAARLQARAAAFSDADPTQAAPADAEATRRLRSLGYLGGAGAPRPGAPRADPKDRIETAAKLAMVTSGELQGDARLAALRDLLREDPGNPQAHLRLGFAELERNRCADAEPHLKAALAAGVPSADAGLGLAQCRGQAGDLAGAAQALAAAQAAEPGNPVVAANLGLLALQQRRLPEAVTRLRDAVNIDPGLLEARFALARALALSGDRAAALTEAERLLGLLPAGAPQRPEVARLIAALR